MASPSKFLNSLFSPIDPTSLAIYRKLFSLVMLFETIRIWSDFQVVFIDVLPWYYLAFTILLSPPENVAG